MTQLISELVKQRLYPRKMRYINGEVMLELGEFNNEQLDTGFYMPEQTPIESSDLVLVGLDDLEFDVMPVHQPVGFIFHLGRCGSTVTVKMLNSLEQYQVISEAEILHLLAKAQMYRPLEDKLVRRKKLMDLFCLLGEAEGRKTIFKMASWEVRLRNEYSQLYPDVKSCLITRNMLEIMVAVLKDPPGRLQRSRMRAIIEREKSQEIDDHIHFLKNIFGPGLDYLAEQTYVDFIGIALQRLLNDVKDTAKPWLVIDHRDVVNRVPTDLCAYFEMQPDTQQVAVMQQRAGFNAKSRKNNEKYKDDSDRKAVEATPLTRSWCENTLQPLLDDIISENVM